MINGGHSFFSLSIFLLLFTQKLESSLPIEISGNNFFSTSYLIAGFKSIKNKRDIETFIEHILNRYNNAGFPFCRIYPEIGYSNDSIKRIALRIDEDERVAITDYIFKINGKSNAQAVKRISRLKPGGYFSLNNVMNAKDLILKTRAFSDISENIVAKNGNYYLIFYLTENRSDYLIGVGSFAQEDMNFSASFYSLNILGTLRQFQFQYEYNRLFSLQYTEPVLISPASFNLDFSLWTYDSARLTKMDGKIIAPLYYNFNASLLSGIEIVSYYRDTFERNHTNNLLGVGFNFGYDMPDWSTNQEINFEYLFRQNDRMKIRYDGSFNVRKLFARPHYWWVQTATFEYFDYFRIGGSKNIRGYLEEEFVVSEAMWLNFEYKRFSLYPLFDIAYIENNLFYSYGFGIEAKTTFANASLIFAWPKDGNWHDGKVHLIFEKGL